MSWGDKLFGVKRTYKGIEFKSGLECKFARLLDLMKLTWQYEPKNFLLSNGIYYTPDFWLPQLNTWVEVKGKIEEHNKEILKVFTKDNQTEMALISEDEGYWSSGGGECKECGDQFSEEEELVLGKCSACNSYFFCGSMMSYHCRACKTHEGDHDILGNWKLGINEVSAIVER